MSVRSLIDAIAQGDSVATQQHFEAELAARITERLDTMRVNVARSMFASEQVDLDEAEHTVPVTKREKDLAALAEPKDKITHKDVLVGRGVVKKEEVEGEETELDEVNHLALRKGSSDRYLYNKTPAGKARERARNQEDLKSQMKFTKRMGGLAGPKGKLPEEVELDEEQLDEISKELASKAYNKMAGGGNDMKNRTGLAGDQSDRLRARMNKRWGEKKTTAAINKDERRAEREFDESASAAKPMKKPTVGSNELHVQHVGGGKYKVHAVGSKWSSGIKSGEHVSDTELDDFAEMGGKIKHLK